MVSVQFVRVPATSDDRTAVLKLGNDKTMEVELPTAHFTEAYRMAKPEKWILGKKGDDGFVELGTAPVAEGRHQIIVVIDKGEQAGGKLELIVIGETPKVDTFLFVNASRLAFAGKVDIDRFRIAPGEHAVVGASATKVDQHGRGFADVNIDFVKDDKEENYFVSSWRLEKNLFGIIVFHHQAKTDKVKMTVFREFVE